MGKTLREQTTMIELNSGEHRTCLDTSTGSICVPDQMNSLVSHSHRCRRRATIRIRRYHQHRQRARDGAILCKSSGCLCDTVDRMETLFISIS